MKPRNERGAAPSGAELREKAADAAVEERESADRSARPEGAGADDEAEPKPYTGPERRAQGMLIAEIIPPTDPRHRS